MDYFRRGGSLLVQGGLLWKGRGITFSGGGLLLARRRLLLTQEGFTLLGAGIPFGWFLFRNRYRERLNKKEEYREI